MKTKMILRVVALLSASLPVLGWAAFTVGGVAFTKRFETALLAEPQPLAEIKTRVAHGTQLAIEEVRGRWLKVNDGKASGWVFSGNLAEERPVETKGLDGLPLAAAETSAAAAARPLAPAAEEYGTRRGLAGQAEDLKWLAETSAGVKAADVNAYLQAQKKGEFQ